MAVAIFLAYAQEDKTFVNKLEGFLRPLGQSDHVRLYMHEISQMKNEISLYLEEASVVLLFVSPDFLDSDYVYSGEIARAIERHKQGVIHVLPILLRPVYWGKTPFAQLQVIPKSATAITLWENQEIAFEEVVTTIKALIPQRAEGLSQDRSASNEHVDAPKGSIFARTTVKAECPHILIVDRNPTIVKLMSSALGIMGQCYQVSSANDGIQALELIIALHPDLIILNFRLPRVHGYEIARRLRSEGNSTPILMLTTPQDQIKELQSSCDDYLMKPFKVSTLYERVEILLRRAGYILASTKGEA